MHGFYARIPKNIQTGNGAKGFFLTELAIFMTLLSIIRSKLCACMITILLRWEMIDCESVPQETSWRIFERSHRDLVNVQSIHWAYIQRKRSAMISTYSKKNTHAFTIETNPQRREVCPLRIFAAWKEKSSIPESFYQVTRFQKKSWERDE